MTVFKPDANGYPFQSRYFKVEGVQMHYVDEGTGPVLLMVHGTPSWSYDFRKVIISLRHKFRCVAIDHIGFGLSDKPKDFDYSTQAHANRLQQLIVHLNLKDITLVLHDFGGPIGWQVALNCPERMKGMVLMNTWLRSSDGEPDFEKMKRILKSPILPFLYRYLNFSPRFLLPQSFGEKKLSAQDLKHYIGPFKRFNERNGPLAFARSLLNDQPWFESLWQQREKLSHVQKMIIWGKKDPVLKLQYLDKLKLSIPDAEIMVIDGCGHFPQEEEPESVVLAITSHHASSTIRQSS